ncbi:MAG: response regulator transcription factor [Myxococcaceae bacterium]|jgi:DNA-binding response OmpR family regulator|nr:response regulator transcription factor [Myxococcaceae bacterium]
MAERVLVVEDDALVRDLVTLNLAHAGYEVSEAHDFPQGQAKLVEGKYELALVDAMLPGGDGFTLIRTAREKGIRQPLVMLTARGDVASRVRGLDCGADDYLPKPFDVQELLARVRAALRRASPGPMKDTRLSMGAYWVRFDTGQAQTSEGLISLSDKELRLMQLFANRPDEALSRADILEEVWGMDAFPTDRTVDNFIMRLRRLFEENPETPKHLVTLRGRGYLFKP